MKKNDVILIGVIIMIAFVSLGALYLVKTGGTQVRISVDGKEYGIYHLNENRVISIETEDGMNMVKIQDGTVYMAEASCPDQICVNTYPLSAKEPGSIVCLPHKLIVEIKE